MLTVKVIRQDGSENIDEATSGFLNTANQSASGNKSFTYFLPDKNHHAIDVYEGNVYVMNENGKTIANYYLEYPKMESEESEPRYFVKSGVGYFKEFTDGSSKMVSAKEDASDWSKEDAMQIVKLLNGDGFASSLELAN